MAVLGLLEQPRDQGVAVLRVGPETELVVEEVRGQRDADAECHRHGQPNESSRVNRPSLGANGGRRQCAKGLRRLGAFPG